MTAPVTAEDLADALPHVRAAPRDAGTIDHICFRPGYGLRTFPSALDLTRAVGVPGERWMTAPWLRLPDGSPDPSIQVSILPLRVMDLVWRDRTGTPHPGDTIVADIETSEANLPEGSLLRAGTALLRVSGTFNTACVKWKARYGQAARDWITADGHPPLRLRGLLCSVEQDGTIHPGDRWAKA